MYKMEAIVEHYSTYEMLTESLRKKLSHTLISYFMHFEIWLSRNDFQVISKMIIDEFPNEDPLYYYTPAGVGSVGPRGILWNRFVNQSRNWRTKLSGVFKNNKKPENKNDRNYSAG